MEDASLEPSAAATAGLEAEMNDAAEADDPAPPSEAQGGGTELPVAETSTGTAAATAGDGPPSSSGVDAQVALHLRAWKERALRMEQLLNKKSARIQELEETEAKLKRLLAMAKRSIDNSKQEVSERDLTIQRLREDVEKGSQTRHTWHTDVDTREPRKIIYKVRHGSLLWCFVEYANENDLDETKEYAWHCFNSDDEVKVYANRASGEPLKLPELSLTPYEVERVKKGLKEDVDRVQEEFRRYRVRSEITRKQKDAEIRKMSANVLARQTEQISETDVAGELQAAKAQIRRLTKSQTEAEEKETEWRRKFEKLLRDYEKLSGTMGETVLATEWRERYEQSVREKEELEKKLEDLKMSTSSMMLGAGGGGGGGGSELQSLRQEFAQYRKRAMNAVEQKEKELSDIHAQYGDSGPSRTGSGGARGLNGFSSASMRRMSTDSSSSLSGFDTPNASTTNEYLKNIVYKYMTTDQNEAKEHMEKAIATVLNFTPTEVSTIKEKRKAQGWFW